MPEAPSKVYAVRNGDIDYVCPKCAFSKSVNVERFLQRDKEVQVKIRCKCYNLQSVLLDRIKNRRKPTDIQGKYFFIPKDRPIPDGEISIKDLSYAGLGSICSTRQTAPSELGRCCVCSSSFFPMQVFLSKKKPS
jgi:hypothetical protein